MTSSIENYNGRNTVVVKCGEDTQFNQNSRMQFTIEDAAKLMAELHSQLWTYHAANQSEYRAIQRALRFDY